MWKYFLPTEVNFGCGSLNGIRETAEAFGTKCVVVTDRIIGRTSESQKNHSSAECASVQRSPAESDRQKR